MENLRIGKLHLYRILIGILRISENLTVQSVNIDLCDLTLSAVNEPDISDDIVIALLIHAAVHNHCIQCFRCCTSDCSRQCDGRLLLHHIIRHDHLRIITCRNIIFHLKLSITVQKLIHDRQVPEIGIIKLRMVFIRIHIFHRRDVADSIL